MNLLSLYYSLLKRYGPQNWWPADSKYEIIVGAILTQATNWNNVEKAISNLKSNKSLNEESILNMEEKELERLIKPAGFVARKVSTLKSITKKLKDLDKLTSVSQMRKELLSIKGIGKETADSIILYAYNLPVFVIDTYTKRFVKYYMNKSFRDYEAYRLFFENNLPKDINIYKEYHALIVEWGKRNRNIKYSF